MTLQDCRTAADVFENRARVVERMNKVRAVPDTGIDLSQGRISGRKGSDPPYVPPPDHAAIAAARKMVPIWILAPELGFVFAEKTPEPDMPFDFPLTIQQIQRAVVTYFRQMGFSSISCVALVSDQRTQVITWPRHVAMYLCKIGTTRSLPFIGRQFGGRDHSTVLHAVSKVKNYLDAGNPDTIAIINDLKAVLKIG